MNYRLICHNIIFIILLLTLTHTFTLSHSVQFQNHNINMNISSLMACINKPMESQNKLRTEPPKQSNNALSLLSMRSSFSSAFLRCGCSLVQRHLPWSIWIWHAAAAATRGPAEWPRSTRPTEPVCLYYINLALKLQKLWPTTRSSSSSSLVEFFTHIVNTQCKREKNTIKTNDDKFNMSVE